MVHPSAHHCDTCRVSTPTRIYSDTKMTHTIKYKFEGSLNGRIINNRLALILCQWLVDNTIEIQAQQWLPLDVPSLSYQLSTSSILRSTHLYSLRGHFISSSQCGHQGTNAACPPFHIRAA